MNRPALAALALVGLLLTGCAATTEASVPNTATTPQGLVATTAPSPDGLSVTDAKYINAVRVPLFHGFGASTIPESVSDADLIAAAHKACDMLAAGTPFIDVTVVTNEPKTDNDRYRDSAIIALQATAAYCPEYSDASVTRATPPAS